MKHLPRAAALLTAIAALAAAPRPTSACAPAPPEGVRVQIAEESALIVWDPASRREHFIRRASFRTTGKEFGFLVPTPDKPELAEVGDDLFQRLEDATKPEVVHDRSFRGVEPTAFCLFFFMLRASKSAPTATASAPVRVLGEQRVAGYDAVILEADDPRALADWLKDHGYAARPELTAWLIPYVAAKWKITAFKIAGDQGAPALGTAAVRMSFTTDRPFYPYREPTDQRDPKDPPAARLLRVFFVGPQRVEGAVGSAAGSPGAAKGPWPGKPTWSDHLTAARDLGPLPVAAPAGAWLTAFEDRSSPRPGTDDLFFTPSPAQQPVKPRPIILDETRRLPMPLDLIGGGALVAGLWIRRRKKAPRAPA